MARLLVQFAVLAACVLVGRLIIRHLRGNGRDVAFTMLNIAVFYWLFFHGGVLRAWAFAAYLAVAVVQYLTLRLLAGRTGWTPWLAFFTPLLALVVVRYAPLAPAGPVAFLALLPYFIGISYMAFRCSLLVLELRNGSAQTPGFFRYLGFCFFVPTMPVGPINPYTNYCQAFALEPPIIPLERCALRILVGFVKYRFIGNICFQLTYTNLLFDDHYHPWIDLPVAMFAYYLYLYCNFSGFCDMAIGIAGLMGVPVAENFNDPFAARNVKDYWNRWHITLSHYMRDVVFTPLSKFLVRIFGPKSANHAVAVTIAVVFLLVGIWHGVGWNYAAFGAAHAAGLVANHYYTIMLKKRLGRDGFKRYMANPWIHRLAVVVTFCYCAAALFLFANTFPEIRQILSVLR